MNNYDCEEIHTVLLQELSEFPAAAVLSSEGQSLLSRPIHPIDLGTLSAAAATTFKYFQVKPGEVVLMNDPYSGGSILSTMTLITGLQNSLLLATRLPFKPKVHLAPSINGEGLRIPPTPILQNGELNRDLLKAISQHPECPAHFSDSLEAATQKALLAAERISRRLQLITQEQPKKWLKDYFACSRRGALKFLEELTVGEARDEITLDDGSRLHLRIEVNESGVLCDFTGSTSSTRYHLTDSATVGICVAAIYAFLDAAVPYNYGVFEPIHVVAPAGSIVNAKFPAPVFLGFTDGSEIVASLILKVLNKIDRSRQVAQSGVSQCAFHLEFNQNLYFYDFLTPGAGATIGKLGANAAEMWKRPRLKPSVEEVERRYPILVRSSSIRHKSGGSGVHMGGDGVTKVIECLAPAKLQWVMAECLKKPEGLAGGKAASHPEIQIVKADGEQVKLPAFGSVQLNAGEQVVVHSAGGGGYGSPE